MNSLLSIIDLRLLLSQKQTVTTRLGTEHRALLIHVHVVGIQRQQLTGICFRRTFCRYTSHPRHDSVSDPAARSFTFQMHWPNYTCAIHRNKYLPQRQARVFCSLLPESHPAAAHQTPAAFVAQTHIHTCTSRCILRLPTSLYGGLQLKRTCPRGSNITIGEILDFSSGTME